jgi:hypothetical protein
MMKKRFLGGFAVVAIAAMAAWNINFASESDSWSDVALANVEALARNEGGGSCTGPKIESSQGALYCQSTNSNPCQDRYGCD